MHEHITKQTETVASIAERIGQADRSGLSPVVAARLTIGLEDARSMLARLLESIPATTTKPDAGPLFD